MKKIMAVIVTILTMVSISTSAFANYYGGYGDPTAATYNSGYYGSYGYGTTGWRTTYSNNENRPAQWFEQAYGEQYGVVFHLYPSAPISRSDAFAPVGKALNKAYQDAGRNFSNAYGVSFIDFTWSQNLYQIAGGLFQRGIMVGYPEDNTVRFMNNITRAEFAKVIVLTARENGVQNSYYGNNYYEFADMQEHWASQYATQAQAMGLMKGVGNNVFNPEGLVTYEEYVAIMIRMSEISGRSNYSMDIDDVAYGISTTMDIDFEDYDYGEDYDEITDISIVGSKTIEMAVGETITLKVKSTDSSTNLNYRDIVWTSSKTSYLKNTATDVDGRYATAKFKALKEGTVNVTAELASDDDVYVRYTIIIEDDSYYDDDDDYVTSITLSPNSVSLKVGETQNIIATVKPNSAYDKSLTWKSDNTSVATVNQNGKITAVSVGNCTVTATANDGSGVVARLNVTVTSTGTSNPDPSEPTDKTAPVVTLEGASNVNVGQTITLVAKVTGNFDSFVIDANSVLGGTAAGLSVVSITKVSNSEYSIKLMGVEVASQCVCIKAGAATNNGTPSAESNEVVIFVNSGE